MKITKSTIVRTVILALALFNQLMSATGHAILPIDDATVEAAVTTAATIVTAVIAWWQNNSFTMAALKGDELMRAHKERAKLEREMHRGE